MNPTFDNFIEESLRLWIDNLLVAKGGGFYNYTGTFAPTTSKFTGWSAYGAPHRQFVYDSSISGAYVPSSAALNGNPTSFNSNFLLNFNQGAIYSSSPVIQTIVSPYSYKEVNVYFTSNSEEKVLFDKNFKINPRSSNTYTSFPYDQVSPCIFIKMNAGTNKMLSFDRMASTVINVRLLFVADNPYLYRSVCSIFRDTKEKFIPIFPASLMPFGFFGNLAAPFSYSVAQSQIQQDSSNVILIKDISVADFPDSVNDMINPQTIGGMIDIKLESLRFSQSAFP